MTLTLTGADQKTRVPLFTLDRFYSDYDQAESFLPMPNDEGHLKMLRDENGVS